MKNTTHLFAIISFFALLRLSCPEIGIGATWTQIGTDIDGESALSFSGHAVSLSADGSIVAIGAYYNNNGNGLHAGHVRVYQNVSGTWAQIGSDIDGEAADDFSGFAVSLSGGGSIVAIGAPYNDGNGIDSGHVRVYQNISGTWTQIGSDIDGEAAGDLSGFAVNLSVDGSTVAVGAYNNTNANGLHAGHVRVYQNISGTWTQIGSDIDGEAAGDQSGWSVSTSADGSIVAIGAPYNDGSGIDSGHVRVYQNVSNAWTQIGSDIDGEAAGDYSGGGVLDLSANGSIVAIPAPGNDGNGIDSGHVRVYQNVSGTWTQIGSDIDGKAAGDTSGAVSLSVGGSIVAIGAFKDDGIDPGYVRVYQNVSGTWSNIGSDINGEAAGDKSGHAVSLSADGSIVAIGAFFNTNGNGQNAGQVRVFTSNYRFPWALFLSNVTKQ